MSGTDGICVEGDHNNIHHNTLTDSGMGDDCDGVDAAGRPLRCFGINLEADIEFNFGSGPPDVIIEDSADDNNVHHNTVSMSYHSGIGSAGNRNVISMNYSCENSVSGSTDIDVDDYDIEIYDPLDDPDVVAPPPNEQGHSEYGNLHFGRRRLYRGCR